MNRFLALWVRRYIRAYADMYDLAGRYFPLIHWYVRVYREAASLRHDALAGVLDG